MRSRMRKSGKNEPFPHDSIFHAPPFAAGRGRLLQRHHPRHDADACRAAAEHRSDLIFLQTDAADRVNGNPDRGAHCPQKLRSSWRKALLAACFIYVAGRYGIGAQRFRAKRFLYGMNGAPICPSPTSPPPAGRLPAARAGAARSERQAAAPPRETRAGCKARHTAGKAPGPFPPASDIAPPSGPFLSESLLPVSQSRRAQAAPETAFGINGGL